MLPFTLEMIAVGMLCGAVIYTCRWLHNAMHELRQVNALYEVLPPWLLFQAVLFPELKARFKSAYWEAYGNGEVDYLPIALLAYDQYRAVLRQRRSDGAPWTEHYYRARRDDKR